MELRTDQSEQVYGKTSQPLVSIAMATFNGARFLKEQLDSLAAQTYPHINIVVSDDGSTDDTCGIIKKYRGPHSIFFSPNNRRSGYKSNFVTAVEKCTGKFIALADQDDIWAPHKIERLLSEIRENYLIHSDVSRIDSEGTKVCDSERRQRHGPFHERVFLDPEYHRLSLLTRKSLCQGCTVLLDRRLLAHALPVPPWEEAHDIWFAFVAASLSAVRYLDEPLTAWRLHESNTSQVIDTNIPRRVLRRTWINGLHRRAIYYRRAIELRRRGIKLQRYPLSYDDEIF
jgi:glycosyltransferase involved in cell wall biosynthesis